MSATIPILNNQGNTPKFKCTLCKKCCQNTSFKVIKKSEKTDKTTGPIYVANPGLPIKRKEAKMLEEQAAKFGMKLDIKPGLIIYDEQKNKVIIIQYSLCYENCPFLMEDGKCMTYDKRPLICRAFPANNYLEKFELVAKFGVKKLASLIDKLCPEDKFYEDAGERLNANIGKLNFERLLYEYFGSGYVDAQVYKIHAEFVKRIVKLLEESGLFSACSEKTFDEFKDKIDWKNAEYLADFVARSNLQTKQTIDEYFEKFNHDKIKALLQKELVLTIEE